MAKSTDSITLGVGDLSVNGEDVGYLGGSVVFEANIETNDFKIGVPQRTVKRVVTGFEASLKASLAQIDIDTISLALGIGTMTTPSGKKRLAFGTDWSIAELSNVQFVHTRPDGKSITIFFPKAQVKPDSSSLDFSASAYILQSVTITALYDSSAGSSAYPLGYVEVTT